MENPVTSSANQSQTAKWIETSARIGYAAKGMVYSLLGWLAVQASLNWGGEVTDTTGVLKAVAEKPFGKVALFGIALGLLCYVAWRFIAAIFDPEHDKNGLKNITRRIIYGLSGCLYSGLAYAAFDIVFSVSSSGSGSSSSSNAKAATVLAQPFGRFLLSCVAVGAASYGFYYVYRGVSSKFRKKLKLIEMGKTQEKWLLSIGRFGLISKGFVAIIVSYFVGQAVRFADASKVKTTEGVLQTLQRQPFGAALMGGVAFGLIAYGIHLLVQSRYRRISPD
ncbi:DUF1206 domain-containing protein [[Limnothrix rosea] IAM M-220]|uniref:DUF1206 domain-containing protein n=1 Tax=[Limnothrix rosea] IAM M-220 TaxID=454133 RepID=UPI00096390AB|nr:DUF1206 domain-containing protein [[Limnothrix rosea] IAM M-220]OKH17463.1 hypothetical protein NIES208_08965 [[Limnothrix rosea] IAM M-220]